MNNTAPKRRTNKQNRYNKTTIKRTSRRSYISQSPLTIDDIKDIYKQMILVIQTAQFREIYKNLILNT